MRRRARFPGQDGELLATPSPQFGAAWQHARRPLDKDLQAAIPGRMAPAIVDPLDVVEVADQLGARGPLIEPLLQPALEAATIEHAGQGIVFCLVERGVALAL